MRRVFAIAFLVAGCKVASDPQRAENVAKAKADMARLRASAEAIVQKSGRCPTASEVERVPDPWGRPYVVLCPGQKGHAVDVVSKGRDGDIGTSDDVRSWD